VNYGLYLPNFGAFGDPLTLVALARDAEVAGWDGFFIWDHIAGYANDMLDPWVGLAAVAQATERVRIGTTVTPLPRRRPQKLARETVSLDRLSGGRLTLGVGIGENPSEYGGLGEETDLRTRGDMLDEGLEVLTGLWSGEPYEHRGAHYRIEGARFTPTPVQRPRIPIWVGAIWPHKRPVRRAARWDGIFPLFDFRDPDRAYRDLLECVEFVRSQRASDDPFDVVQSGVTPGQDGSRAREIVSRYERAGTTWWLEAIAPYRLGKDFDEPWDLAPLRERVLQACSSGVSSASQPQAASTFRMLARSASGAASMASRRRCIFQGT
jgi:alkanesulfonate monooxygenase SsuD/methylene tetrahydromethanopterin reductase-like flavin-dependent oxidoreductase (luciferase family)